jgi:hypothetical protein
VSLDRGDQCGSNGGIFVAIGWLLALLGAGSQTCCCYFYCYCYCLVSKSLTLPMLPLPPSTRYHSNRTDLLFPTVPLPPRHCHSPRHCHPCNHPYHCHFYLFSFKPLQLCPYCHCHPLTGTIRTALTSRIDWCHCHPATATSHPAATPATIHTTATPLPFFIFFFPFKSLPLCQYCHYHPLTGTIRTALTSRIDWCHCHPATATR